MGSKTFFHWLVSELLATQHSQFSLNGPYLPCCIGSNSETDQWNCFCFSFCVLIGKDFQKSALQTSLRLVRVKASHHVTSFRTGVLQVLTTKILLMYKNDPSKEIESQNLQCCAIEIMQHVFRKKIRVFGPPFWNNLKTNDTSFEIFDKLLESGKILCMASSSGW